MTDVIVEIVTRVIVHAQTMLDDGAYNWPATRAALEKSWPTSRRDRSATRTFGGCAGSSRLAMRHGKSVRARQNDAGAAEAFEELAFCSRQIETLGPLP